MAAIYYSGPISTVPTNKQLPSEKKIGTKFIYMHGMINSAHHPDHLCIYFLGSPMFPSEGYKLRGKLNIPCSGYKKPDAVRSGDLGG